MTTPIVTPNQRNSNDVGERAELGRYRTDAGVARVLYGQRVGNVVRFLPGNFVVLVSSLGPAEDNTCRSRTTMRDQGRTRATRRERPNGVSEPRCLVARQRGDRS